MGEVEIYRDYVVGRRLRGIAVEERYEGVGVGGEGVRGGGVTDGLVHVKGYVWGEGGKWV